MRSLGEKIREARNRTGMSQASMGKALGFADAQMLTRYENDRSEPSIYTLRKIALLASLPMVWFFEGDGFEGEEGDGIAPEPRKPKVASVQARLAALEAEVASLREAR